MTEDPTSTHTDAPHEKALSWQRWNWQRGFGTFMPVPSSQGLDIRACGKGLLWVGGGEALEIPTAIQGTEWGQKGTPGPGNQ